MQRKVSYAQNAEDIRVWRAFQSIGELGPGLTYVDVGANEPRHLSITASLADLGWSGLLIEADPDLAAELRVHRSSDVVVECAAAREQGTLTFYRVPGTGLGTLDAKEAHAAAERGFTVETVVVPTLTLNSILENNGLDVVHFMSIDVEGAESEVLAGLDLDRHRPWTMCIEAVLPGSSVPSHEIWEARLLESDYVFAAFDGVNRWYVAQERVAAHASLLYEISIPFNVIDAGEAGWVTSDAAALLDAHGRADVRRAWQRELILNDLRSEVPTEEYERQIAELRTALVAVEGSKTFAASRQVARIAKGVIFRCRRVLDHLPGPIATTVVRKRHLRHVNVNMGHLTPAAFLGSAVDASAVWINPEGLPVPPEHGLDLVSFTVNDVDEVHDWLSGGPWDDDAMLDRRMDNHGDELGRAMRALRGRLEVHEASTRKSTEPAVRPDAAGAGTRVLFDARSLQTSAFGHRGIGRFARAALEAAREAIDEAQLILLVDDGLDPLPDELIGSSITITRVTTPRAGSYGLFIQPSPMTASCLPLLPLLASGVQSVAIVYDFIPLHHPSVYLRDVASRAEYALAMDSLRLYDEYICISRYVQDEVRSLMADPHRGAPATSVAWPQGIAERETDSGKTKSASSEHREGPIVLMTGDDARKNTFGGLAAIGAATAGDASRNVVVIGMAGQETRVHHWSIAAAMRPGEAVVPKRMTDNELAELLASASVVVVPSFDEGLSLPVIEAALAGAPVVASDIPSHRELIGRGSYLVDPTSPTSMARAIRRHMNGRALQAKQASRIARHEHELLEQVIRKHAKAVRSEDQRVQESPVIEGVSASAGRPLRVAIAGPWLPMRSGVADFTATTTIELAKLADVTVYSTAGADVAATAPSMRHRSVESLRDHIDEHDVIVVVMGNSHFHLPYLAVIDEFEPVVITHDTRLVEFYLALRDRGGVSELMLRGSGEKTLRPPLDEQIEDMRLLQSTAFWEVARRARMLIAHTPTAAPRIELETGRNVRLLPFANQRVPAVEIVTQEMRSAARARLGFNTNEFAGTIHLATFGYLDVRTKMSDVVLEAAAWLTQWGHQVSLHFVGQASDPLYESLMARAAQAGIANVDITGYVDEATFQDYLLAIDLGIQLRISPMLGVSGPLSDLAAFGTPAVASRGLAIDVDAPAFVDQLPDDVSPVIVAEAIEARLEAPMPEAEREHLRKEYLARKSATSYANNLLALLQEAANLPSRSDR